MTGIRFGPSEPLPVHNHATPDQGGRLTTKALADVSGIARLDLDEPQVFTGGPVSIPGVVVTGAGGLDMTNGGAVTYADLNTTPSQSTVGSDICTIGAEAVTDARAWQYPDRAGAGGVTPLEARHRALVSKTANYTLTEADDIVLGNATGGAFTLTLPTAASKAGRIYVAKKTDAGANAVTLDGDGAETIDGAATLDLTAAAPRATLVSDGTNWQKIA